MISLKRVGLQVGAVFLVSLIAGAGLVHLRKAPMLQSTDAPIESVPYEGVPSETEEAAPLSVDSNAVALRARARVEIANKAKSMPVAPETAAIERLKRIRNCEKVETADCPLGSLTARLVAMANTDPSGYHQALIEETVDELAFLKAMADDDIRNGREPQLPLLSLASAYIKHPDDNVREQALALASLLTKRDAATVIQIAVKALRTTVSGPLTVQALRLMVQTRSADPALVDKSLKEALKTGGWDVRDAVAAEILPFLTRANRNSFAEILTEAPVRSKLALHLRLGLEEFDRMERL